MSNGLDWLLIVIMVGMTIRGYMRGAVRSIFAVAAILIAFLVASWVYWWGGQRMAQWVAPEAAARMAAYLLITGVVVLSFAAGGHMLQKAPAKDGLAFGDRLVGAVFGFIRGCLFGVGALLAVAFSQPQSELVSSSTLSPYFLVVAHEVSFVVPKDLQDQITDRAYQMEQKLPDWMKRR